MAAAEALVVTEDALLAKLDDILKNADLSTFTMRKAREELAEHFGIPMEDRKTLIKMHVDAFLAKQQPPEEEEEEERAPKEKKTSVAPKRKAPAREAPAAAPKKQRGGTVVSERQMLGLGRAAAPKARRGAGPLPLKDPNAPKKPNSAYNIFTSDKRPEVKALEPKKSFGQLGALVGRMWQTLTAEEREPYEARARLDKERYEAEMRVYQKPTDAELWDAREAAKTLKRSKSYFNRPVKLSEQLGALLGASELSRGDVTKRLHAYFKEHSLKDPEDGMYVLSDAALEAITGEKRFKAFTVWKLLKEHFTVPEGAAAGEEEEEEGEDEDELGGEEGGAGEGGADGVAGGDD